MFNLKSVKSKFLMIIIFIIFVIFSIVTIILSTSISSSNEKEARKNFVNIANNIKLSYDVLDHNLKQTMQSLLGVIKAEFPETFYLDENTYIKVGKYDSPLLKNGENILNNDF